MLGHFQTSRFELESLESRLLLSTVIPFPAVMPALQQGAIAQIAQEITPAGLGATQASIESSPAPDLFSGLREAAECLPTVLDGNQPVDGSLEADAGIENPGVPAVTAVQPADVGLHRNIGLHANWTGNIPTGTVWPAGVVQRITGTVTVPAGATLMIEPGAIIKFTAGTRLDVSGTLNALGTLSSPIVFTSINDDSVGGDTNGNGAATTPKAGDWSQIFFRSPDAAGALQFAEIRFAGGSGADAVRIDGGPLQISDLKISDVGGTGLYVGIAQAIGLNLDRVAIRNTGRDGLKIATGSASVNVTDLTVNNVKGTAVVVQDAGKWTSVNTTLTGTGITAINFTGGTITDKRTWGDDAVYLLTGTPTVGGGGELTIPAGRIIKCDGARLDVSGTLNVAGTAASPVIFTSLKDDSVGGDTNGNGSANAPAPGDWDRIYVWAGGNTGVVNMTFGQILYAGRISGTSGDSSISAGGGTLNISDSVIRNGFGEGIWLAGGKGTFQNNTISDVARYGLRIDTSSPVTIVGNQISNAKWGPIRINASSVSLLSGNTSTGSGLANSIYVFGGTIADARLWHENLNYYIASVTISASGSLDISPGRVIKMLPGAKLDVTGKLTAIGTAQQPIIFTSEKDDSVGGDVNGDAAASAPAAGDWDRIYADGGSVSVEYVQILYAGRISGSSADSAISAGQGAITRLSIRNSRIEHSYGEGIWVASGQATLENNTISDVARFGLRFDSNDPSTVVGNNIVNARSGPMRVGAAAKLTASRNSSTGSGLNNAVYILGGSITDHQVWNYGFNTYYITGGISIRGGGSWEVPAGLVLKVASGVRIDVEGTLTARGTDAAPVIFTSFKDDSSGGDTNGDAAASTPTAGDWDRIYINDAGGKAVLDHVQILYAGRISATQTDSSISIGWNGTLELTNSIVRFGAADGVWVAYGGATVSNTTISDVAEYGIRIDDTTRKQTLTGDTITSAKGGAVYQKSNSDLDLTGSSWNNCGLANAIFVDGGSVSTTRSWRGDATYWITSDLVVGGNQSLTIGAGATLKLQLRKGVQLDGNLIAQGTAAKPVLFTSFKDDTGGDTNGDGSATTPAAGDWFSIWHRGGEVNLTFTEVRFAGIEPVGTGFAATPAILTDAGKMTLTNVTIRDAFDAGFRSRRNANAIVDGLDIRNAGLDGISFEGGAADVRRVRLEGIKRYAHTVDPAARWQLSDVETVSAGVKATVVTKNGTINSTWTLGQLGVVIFLGNDGFEVPNTAKSSLTILPGTILKMPKDFRIEGWNIRAEGSAAAPILFTSVKDDSAGGDTNGDGAATTPAAGDWGYLAVNNAASTVAYAEFRYGGITASGSRSDTALLLNGAAITARNLVVRDSGGNGIEVLGANIETTIENALIYGFAKYGVFRSFGGSTHLRLVNDTIVGGQVGVRLENLKATLVNNIITGASVAGVQMTSSACDLTVRFNDVFNPAAANGNYHNIQATTFQPKDRTGELSADPLFVDPARRIFEPGAGSPVVDAASGDEAPFADLYGRPRRNDTAVPNKGAGEKPYVDIGALEKTSSGTGVDLLITSVQTQIVAPKPPQAALQSVALAREVSPSQVIITVKFSDVGSEAITNQQLGFDFFFRPASYGEDSKTLPNIEIGKALEILTLAPGGEATLTKTFNLPPLWTGPFQPGAVIDTANQILETQPVGELNNTFLAPEPFFFDNPNLAPGEPLQFDLARGPFVFDVNPGITDGKLITLQVQAASPAIIFFGPSPGVPDASNFDTMFRVPANQKLSVTPPAYPNAVMSVFVDGAPPAGSPFSIEPSVIEHGLLTDISTHLLGNSGPGTLTFDGGPFPDDAVPGLIAPDGRVFTPMGVRHTEKQNQIIATFDFTGAPTGMFDAFVTFPGGGRALLNDPLTIAPGGAGQFGFNLSGPDVMRAGVPMPFTLDWSNTGIVDMPAQLITLDLPGSAHVTFQPDGKQVVDQFALLALTPYSTNFTTLPAQTSGHLDFWLTLDPGQGKVDLPIQAVALTDPALNTPLNLDAILADSKPASADPARWDGMSATLQISLGKTWSSALNTLALTANIDPAVYGDPSAPISPERIDDYIANGASAVPNLIADKIAEAYPKPADPTKGDGIHQDFVIMVAIEDYSASFVGMETITLPDGAEVPVSPIFNHNLPGTQRDATRWTDYFSNDLNIPASQITVLRDRLGDTTDNLSLDRIRQAWKDTAAKADADDKIKFVYSGHGSRNGGSMIMNTPYDDADDQYVDGAKLKQMFADFPMPGEIYMVFDSCHSQTLGLDLNDVPRLKWNSAVSSDQTAVDGNATTDSFTDKLVAALRDRKNDRDKDGRVTIDEAFRAAQQSYSAESNHTDPEDNRVPRSGGDSSVNQELHDDLGNAARNKSWTSRLIGAVQNAGSKLVKTISNVFSKDPNEKVGPNGYGAQHFVPNSEMPFTIYFENDPKQANAAAQVVTVTDQLDPNLDWNSFQFGTVTFGKTTLTLVGTQTNASAQIYLPLLDVTVSVTGSLDAKTGIVKWVFTTLDPFTKLPPNVAKPEGEGHVNYSIRPKGGTAHGTEIHNAAAIVFDQNEPITTNTTVHALDAKAPQFAAAVINGGAAQRSDLRRIQITFTEDTAVNFGLGDLQLVNVATGQPVSLAKALLTVEKTSPVATLDLAALALPAGNYRLTLKAGAVHDIGGLAMTQEARIDFHVLPGDANGDRSVNDLDLYRVWRNLTRPAALRDPNDDLTGDGQVTTADLELVRANYRKNLPAPAPVALTGESHDASGAVARVSLAWMPLRPSIQFGRDAEFETGQSRFFTVTDVFTPAHSEGLDDVMDGRRSLVETSLTPLNWSEVAGAFAESGLVLWG
jgi:hypothetical protein